MQTPFYIYMINLTIKFCKMTMYLHKKFNGLEKLSIPIKLAIVSVTVALIINYLLDVALYVYPYLEFLREAYLLNEETFIWVQ